MKKYSPSSTVDLSTIPSEGTISSGDITFLLVKITDLEVENSSINLSENDLGEQVLSKLLQNIIEGRNDKKTIDGVYLIEVGGHFVMMNLERWGGIIKYKVFDSLSHAPDGSKRLELLTNILGLAFGSDKVFPSENSYVKLQQGVDIEAQDVDNCGLLCFFAQLTDEKKLILGELLPSGVKYHDLNKALNRLRGKDVATIDLNSISQELLDIFPRTQPSKNSPQIAQIATTENDELRGAISTVFKKYANSKTATEVKSGPFSKARSDDLKRLERISQYLSEIKRKEGITVELLNKIGEETAKIIVNNSSKNNFIRNRYGLIGSKSDFTTQDGIEFMGLQTLRYVQVSDLDPSKMDDLFQGLQTTKKKIDFAIREEKGEGFYSSSIGNFKKSLINPDELLKFAKFTRDFYSSFLLKKIESELKILEKVDYSQTPLSKEDKYLVSRIFAKIGERAKEFLDHNKDSGELPAKQLKIINFLKDVRNKIIHSPLALISEELSGQSLRNIAEVIGSGLRGKIVDDQQGKIDSFLQIFQRSGGAKISSKAAVEKDHFLEEAELFSDRITKYCKLKPETSGLEDLLAEKDLLEKRRAEKAISLEAERSELYGSSILKLEDEINNLLKENSFLDNIENKLSDARTKKQKLEKEVGGHKRNLQKYNENLALSQKEGLSGRDLVRLKGSFKVQNINEVVDKIKTSLESEQKFIDDKTSELDKSEKFIKQTEVDANFQKMQRLKKNLKEEKKKTEPRLEDFNKRKKEFDEEIGVKVKALNGRISKIEQKIKDLEIEKEQILKFTLEINPSTTDTDKFLNDDFVGEIKEILNDYKLKKQRSVEELNSTNPTNKICKKLDRITEEMGYLHQTYSSDLLDPEKRSHILQQSFSIIAQYSRDIEDLERNSSFNSMQKMVKNAANFNESWRATIRTRNKEISHDVDSFNEDGFFRTVRQDTLSMQQDINAIREILTFDSRKSKSENPENIFDFTFGVLMNNAGLGHLRLENYDKAEEFLKKALDYFDRIQAGRFGSNDQTVLFAGKNGIDERKITLFSNLSLVFMLSHRDDEALELLNKVEKLEIQNKGSTSKITLGNQAFLLQALGRFEEAKEKIKQAYNSPGENPDGIALHYIIITRDATTYEEQKIILDKIITNTSNSSDSHAKIKALSLRAFISAKEKKFSESKSWIKEMENYIKENEGMLKDEHGSQFLKLKQQPIAAKIGMLELQFISKNDELLNPGSLTKDDISYLKEAYGDIVRCNENKIESSISKDLIYNFSCVLSNAANAVRNQGPKTSIDLLNKALHLQKDYKLDCSITLFQLGKSYCALSRTKDIEHNQDEAIKCLESARSLVTNHMLSSKIYWSIASINMEKGNYKAAFDNYRVAKQKWPKNPEVADIDSDIKSCSEKSMRCKAAGESLLRSYQQNKKLGRSSLLISVDKSDLQNYIKYDLGNDAVLPEPKNGKTFIKLNESLVKSLEEKLQTQVQRS
ncbi:MAG: tetratricopeptide (TPR) repeat protein [Rickettsiales bacterium]|jgi:tetratricopeptide (TPR) repeat protein